MTGFARLPSLFTALVILSLAGPAHAAETYTATDPAAAPADEAALLGKEEPEQTSDDGTAWVELESESSMGAAREAEKTPPAKKLAGRLEESDVARSSSTKASQGWGMFDSVPEKSRDSLATRLTLIQELIKKYGRAYDYRIHTTAQLKKVRDLLDHEAAATK